MSAELLRRAATQMRARAREVPYFDDGVRDAEETGEPWPEHCSAWTPASALAAANLLDMCARVFPEKPEAVIFARTYLRENTS